MHGFVKCLIVLLPSLLLRFCTVLSCEDNVIQCHAKFCWSIGQPSGNLQPITSCKESTVLLYQPHPHPHPHPLYCTSKAASKFNLPFQVLIGSFAMCLWLCAHWDSTETSHRPVWNTNIRLFSNNIHWQPFSCPQLSLLQTVAAI